MRQLLRRIFCPHFKQEYQGQLVTPTGYRIVAVRCLRCGKVKKARGVGTVIWESP